jgi:hypothetical protein
MLAASCLPLIRGHSESLYSFSNGARGAELKILEEKFGNKAA